MTHRVYICAAVCFDGSGKDNACLKRHLKKHYHLDARRFSRLTLLTLAGSLPLHSGQLPHDTAVYWGGTFSSPSVFNEMIGNVFRHEIAKPFDFLANLHNAPAFHTAAALGLSGLTVFQPVAVEQESWSKPLLLAVNHVQRNGGSVLVGWSHEATEGSGEQEGCCCLCLSSSGTDDMPEITISRVETNEPECGPEQGGLINAVSEWLDRLMLRHNKIRMATGGNIVLEIESGSSVKLLRQTNLE